MNLSAKSATRRDDVILQLRASTLRRVGGPLLLHLAIALGMLWPYRHSDFRIAGDLNCVLGMITEARNALEQGQFPIRLTPNQFVGTPFPLFQYYGNFPFTVTGSIALLVRDNPYLAWKIAMLLTLVAGAAGARRLAYLFTRREDVSAIAAAIFLLAPYQFTDLNARGAFTEQVAFNILPWAFYLSYRAFASHRWRYAIVCAVAWAVIGMTHNISYLYGVAFMAVLLLSYLRRDRQSLRRLGRLTAAGALQALLLVWYFVPQLVTLKSVVSGRQPLDPYQFADLSPLPVLLSPRLTATPAASTAPGLGLQVGWPILCGAILAISALTLGKLRRFRSATAVRLTVLFAAALFIAWSPFDFWKHLPRTLWFVQFPYRLLMFTTLFGSMLAALALSAWFRGRIPWAAAGLTGAAIALAVLPYLPLGEVKLWPQFVAQQTTAPFIGYTPLNAYLVTPEAAESTSWLSFDGRPVDWPFVLDHAASLRSDPALKAGRIPAFANKDQVIYGRTIRYAFDSSVPVLLMMPVLYYPRVLDVRDQRTRIRYGNVGHFLAVRLPPGKHRLQVRYVGVPWANAVSAAAWALVAAVGIAAFTRKLLPSPTSHRLSRSMF